MKRFRYINQETLNKEIELAKEGIKNNKIEKMIFAICINKSAPKEAIEFMLSKFKITEFKYNRGWNFYEKHQFVNTSFPEALSKNDISLDAKEVLKEKYENLTVPNNTNVRHGENSNILLPPVNYNNVNNVKSKNENPEENNTNRFN